MTESLKCHKESVWLILAQYSQLPRHGGKSSQEPGFSGLALAVTHASLEMLVTPLSLSLFKCAMGTILPVLMTPHVTVRIDQIVFCLFGTEELFQKCSYGFLSPN